MVSFYYIYSYELRRVEEVVSLHYNYIFIATDFEESRWWCHKLSLYFERSGCGTRLLVCVCVCV